MGDGRRATAAHFYSTAGGVHVKSIRASVPDNQLVRRATARDLPLPHVDLAQLQRSTVRSALKIAVVVLSLIASVARGQQTHHRTPALDLTLARHTVSGGFIDFRDGAMLDLLAAGELRSAPRWAWVAAGGASVILGGLGDRCLIRPDGGGCAPQGNFVAVSLLSGAQVALGPAGARALVGRRSTMVRVIARSAHRDVWTSCRLHSRMSGWA